VRWNQSRLRLALALTNGEIYVNSPPSFLTLSSSCSLPRPLSRLAQWSSYCMNMEITLRRKNGLLFRIWNIATTLYAIRVSTQSLNRHQGNISYNANVSSREAVILRLYTQAWLSGFQFLVFHWFRAGGRSNTAPGRLVSWGEKGCSDTSLKETE